MSRSGYSDDLDQRDLAMYRGMVASSIRGRRGQAFFRDLLAALDAMPKKELIAHHLVKDGEHCALGVLGEARGVPVSDLDPYCPEAVAGRFNIADCLARETVYMNDEAHYGSETPAARWVRVRAWVEKQIREPRP